MLLGKGVGVCFSLLSLTYGFGCIILEGRAGWFGWALIDGALVFVFWGGGPHGNWTIVMRTWQGRSGGTESGRLGYTITKLYLLRFGPIPP